jgi:hypothetical protein
MNQYRSILRRRQLLKSGSLAALGALSSALVGRRLFSFPGKPEATLVTAATPQPTSATPEPVIDCTDPEHLVADEASDGFVELKPAPRPLSREEEYAEFLHSLDLRHISSDEVIDPHRNICNGVDNELPPERLWEKLSTTLRVADEIRERLGAPLVRFSSAYRSPRYNCQIPGAVHNSYHTRNQALDIVYYCKIRDAYNMAVRLRNEGFFRGGIGLYPTFIHIDTRGYSANWRG